MSATSTNPDTGDIIAAYARIKRWRAGFLALLGLAVAVAFLLDLGSGPAAIPPSDAMKILLGLADAPRAQEVILWQLRLPIALMAVLVGASLALAGAEMQTVLANPLAEPITLGVSSAAALGAAVGIVLGGGATWFSGPWLVAGNAFLFALGALVLIHVLAQFTRAGPETLILFGIAVGFAANASLSLVQFVASADALQQLVFWIMGSLARADWTVVPIVAGILCVVVPFSMISAWKLTALRLGEDRALSLGVNTRRLRLAALVRVSLLCATGVAFVGVIGFVGLVGPHIARMLVGEDHRYFLPASMLTGALTVSVASIASKLIVPGIVMPIGIVTTLVGLPAFVWLVIRRHRRAP